MGKGRLVGITGRIQTGSYEKDGRKVYTTDIVADRVEFLDRGNSSSEGGASFSGGSGYGSSAPSQSSGPAIPEGFSQLTDDDIPF